MKPTIQYNHIVKEKIIIYLKLMDSLKKNNKKINRGTAKIYKKNNKIYMNMNSKFDKPCEKTIKATVSTKKFFNRFYKNVKYGICDS
ncbi:hypothetical protein ALNOE001_01050 [Candidatus Methanobinarius endosymbioticus]|uniref:Uncharacterized protein n=1 Tax=Candidatus Methanobinarius endosymbioticus TaxID=2006182 RepID=A0A366MDX1_9EURY|nr:hypothetical protein ALNOE001_01050 [Candidatus Methanobinarius endosymbioticus]